jgi:IS605 OrfB family transposase
LVNEILRDPSKYGRWRYVKKTKRIKWEQDIKAIHKFYEVLKDGFKLPPKFAISCEREASFIAKSVINNENNSGKCIIKSYRARCDNQSYRIEFRDYKCYLRLRNFGEIEVTGYNRKWFEKFRGWSYGDLLMKLENGVVKLYVTMRKRVKLADASENAIAVDLNFEEVVVGDGIVECRIRTPLRRIMHIKRNHIEKTQKKYPKKWLVVKGIRKAISKWWRRISRITDDFVKQTSKKIIRIAKSLGYDTIILEDLNGLKSNQAKMKKLWRERFTFFVYRKLQNWIEWQAMKEGLAVVYVKPEGTSITCPECGSKLIPHARRVMECKNCGIKLDRDSVAVRNLVSRWLSILRCGV